LFNWYSAKRTAYLPLTRQFKSISHPVLGIEGPLLSFSVPKCQPICDTRTNTRDDLKRMSSGARGWRSTSEWSETPERVSPTRFTMHTAIWEPELATVKLPDFLLDKKRVIVRMDRYPSLWRDTRSHRTFTMHKQCKIWSQNERVSFQIPRQSALSPYPFPAGCCCGGSFWATNQGPMIVQDCLVRIQS